jgi:hypothetical protein
VMKAVALALGLKLDGWPTAEILARMQNGK